VQGRKNFLGPFAVRRFECNVVVETGTPSYPGLSGRTGMDAKAGQHISDLRFASGRARKEADKLVFRLLVSALIPPIEGAGWA
jgi:hypothetical protein